MLLLIHLQAVRENGCICMIEDKIRAWIPRSHFGDTVGNRLRSKFAPGKVSVVLAQDLHRNESSF